METNGTPENTFVQSDVTSDVAPERVADDVLFGRVDEVIAEVRPFIQSDGGDIELLKVEDSVVYVRLTGACVGCPSSMVTLKQGVEVRIREEIPQIESVEMV